MTDLDLAAIRNLVDRSVPLNLYTERALLAEIDRLNATIQRVREVADGEYPDGHLSTVVAIHEGVGWDAALRGVLRALEGGEAS